MKKIAKVVAASALALPFAAANAAPASAGLNNVLQGIQAGTVSPSASYIDWLETLINAQAVVKTNSTKK